MCPAQRLKQFAGAFGRQHVVLSEVDHGGLETGSVLHWSLDLVGEYPLL